MIDTDQYPTSFILQKEHAKALRWLKKKWDRSASSVVRHLVIEAAKREGMPEDWEE